VGHAPRYGAAGAVVMGDAAHPVSPAGGQGANMSIADARALAELAWPASATCWLATSAAGAPPIAAVSGSREPQPS